MLSIAPEPVARAGADMTETLILPSRLDLNEARRLCVDLRIHADGPLTLDASEVEILGGLCLQVLLAARQHWIELGHSLSIAPRSEAFDRGVSQFGLTLAHIECGA